MFIFNVMLAVSLWMFNWRMLCVWQKEKLNPEPVAEKKDSKESMDKSASEGSATDTESESAESSEPVMQQEEAVTTASAWSLNTDHGAGKIYWCFCKKQKSL